MQAVSSAISSASPWQVMGALQLRRVRYRAHATQPPHRHEDYTLSLVVSGELEEISTSTCRAGVGSVVIKPADWLHADSYGARGACVVQIRPDAPPASKFGFHEYRWFESAMLARAVLACLGGKQHGKESAEFVLWDALASALDKHPCQNTAPPRVWFRRVLDRLECAVSEPVSVSGIARDVDIHPVHLARVFRARFGRTIAQHVRERRVLAAWRAMEADTAPLAAISARFGFADQAHMTRAFSKVLGLAPGRLKRLGIQR
jgi:AraC-like DNA-binding protein